MAWKKLVYSGSDASLNQLYVGNSVTSSYFKGDGSALTNLSVYNLSGSALTYTDLATTGSTVTITTSETFITSASINLNNISSSVLILARCDFAKSVLVGTETVSLKIRRNYTGTQIGVDAISQGQAMGTNNFGPVTLFGIDTPYSSSLTYSLWGKTDVVNGATTDKYHISLIELRAPTGQSGSAGVGLTTGGSANQVLVKKSETDYDTGWTSSLNLTSVTASFSGSFYGNGANLTGQPKSFGITIDGAGSTITTGVKGDITIPYNMTIQSWYLVADQAGSIVIDVWKDTFANYPPTVADTIAGTEKPTLSSQTSNSDTNLTTWTSSISSGDTVRFNVDSVSTVTRINLIIKGILS